MQPNNLYQPPLSDSVVDDLHDKDGELETMPLLSLDLSDRFITQNLHNRIQMSIDYFNSKDAFSLRDKRIKNLRMIRGDQIDENQLYHYQTPYKDNELFVGVDAMISYISASLSSPQVYPASKKEESKILARDLLSYIKGHSQKFDLEAELEAVALNIQAQFVGILTLEWKPDYGETGDLIPRSVNPMHYFVDKHARRGSNPAFEGEVLKDDIEGLIAKFPKKEAEILKLFGIQRKGTQNTSKEIAYRQVYFTYYDKKYRPQEAVAWYVQDLVLDKRKNPNWLYKGEGQNFLDMPRKPYIKFNLFTDGEHVIDMTSAVDQAVPMQEMHNKEGRQVIDNLATANGFRVVAAGAMTDDALENLTGDPNQSVIVKLKPQQKLDDVYKQVEPHIVSGELITDRDKSAEVIHGILATPSQFRGDDTDQTQTASEAQLIKNQASGRQDRFVRAMDRGLTQYYQFLVQMMTVWYTEKHYMTIDGGDGQFDFIEMHQNKIEQGMTVLVKGQSSGDKARLQAIAQNGAELKFLSPLDWYKYMDLDDPQRLYDNLVKWTTNAAQLAMDLGSQEQDRDAVMDFSELMAGRKVKQRDDITPQYLDSFRKQMISDDFLSPKLSNKIKMAVITFAQEAMVRLALRTELDEASDAPLMPEPLPPTVQATLPQQPMQPMGQPQAGLPPQMQPQAPAAPGASPIGTPLPQVGAPMQPGAGIQGVMQTANAGQGINLSPQVQPQAGVDISALTPR
jgi:hypothetical protein